VQDLQSLLAEYGYLSSTNATGFFGNLTLGAVQKFQCDKDIVCTGGAGWGTVGPKTRNILNSLSSSLSSSSLSPASSSVTALTAEIQALEAELANLEKQLPAAGQ
jgi:peptidoglycan hydrolase-like protein with peptidoglycan-binding domain